MQFHAEFFPIPFPQKIKHQDKLLLIGSCFTEQIGAKLSWHKFQVLENPNGILFNPVSILKSIERITIGTAYTKADLFENDGIWGSWDHHTRFSSVSPQKCLDKINRSLSLAHEFLFAANWIFLTLGSAFVYERKEIEPDNIYSQVVANCHKIPPDKFIRRLLSAAETESVLQKIAEAIFSVNAAAKIVLTISPVRHLRDGFIENNRSKAVLIQSVHSALNDTNVSYFPAYELVIDDLRDYRFFAEDMVHPNHAATNYVWEKFTLSAIESSTKELMKSIAAIMQARNHKPFNPDSILHKKFLQKNVDSIRELEAAFPHLNLKEELLYFKSELG